MKKYDSKKIIKTILSKNEIKYAEVHYLKVAPTQKITWYKETTEYDDKNECIKACEKRAKAIRKHIADSRWGTVEEWLKAYQDRKRTEKKLQNDCKKINEQLEQAGLYGMVNAISTYRTGANVESYFARYNSVNGIFCTEFYEKYSSRCKFTKTNRAFTLNIRKGWNITKVGGLLTFYKGKFNRNGIACEWIEQGKEINSFRTVSGFLVRGEHIEAKSLKEAQHINGEHRAMQLARLLNVRKRLERKLQQIENGTLLVTFADSINAGNCNPGTRQFKQQVEEAVGHEVKSLSINELRKYGKQFGVEYYTERVIRYIINK